MGKPCGSDFSIRIVYSTFPTCGCLKLIIFSTSEVFRAPLTFVSSWESTAVLKSMRTSVSIWGAVGSSRTKVWGLPIVIPWPILSMGRCLRSCRSCLHYRWLFSIWITFGSITLYSAETFLAEKRFLVAVEGMSSDLGRPSGDYRTLRRHSVTRS